MAAPLPRLRLNLDFMPSPVPDRPGLLMRDPFHYSEATLIIPPALVECLQLLDGRSTDLDLRAKLVEITGDLQVGELEKHLLGTLSSAGFLEDEQYDRMRRESHQAFRDAPQRLPVHAGSGYPEDGAELRTVMARYMDGADGRARDGALLGVAAPHVSPDGGWECYQSAYGLLGPEYKNKTFVVLGTSHYGEPDRFGLTRKPFLTPYGEAATDVDLVDRLAREGSPAVAMEDYCHAVEHSIEFQVVFLQHMCGPDIRILPILCGPFLEGLHPGRWPENGPGAFLDALARLAVEERERLCWVMGVDMAHMGRRYGDDFPARVEEGPMRDVAARDRERIDRLNAGDARGFWDSIRENRDPLKWCGSSPFYTFLYANPGARGELLRYRQWNIDDESVVTFAGMAFR